MVDSVCSFGVEAGGTINPKEQVMRRIKCSGCGHFVDDYEDYEEFQLCNSCEQEAIEEDERRIEEEEECFISMYCSREG